MKLIVPVRLLTSLSLTAALGLAGTGCGPTEGTFTKSAASTSPDEVAAQSAWSAAIAATPTADAEEGCFESSYPSMTWNAVDCAPAPTYLSTRPSSNAGGETVGNGADYAAETTGLISKTIGSFPTVTGLKTETDDGDSNTYSIQLNSNFMSGTTACKGVSGCQSWSQFVYSSTQKSAFIQDWLIGIGTCPSSAWNDVGGGDCYKNSTAVTVPAIPITSLSTFSMSGAATSSKDSLVFTAAGKAYKTSQADSVTNLSTAWNASEFNIIGDGGASEAVFNTGSSVTVKIALTDGSTKAPTCAKNAGTTGETNDLTIGACTTKSGTSPYVEFTEKR